jgi:cell division protein FtsL
LVPGGRRRPRSRRDASALLRFRVVVTCLLVLAVAGVLRVSLAVQAAEAAVDASALREQVRAEKLESRVLEADRSVLASPSRIEVLACETLNMDRPAEVCYIELPATSPSRASSAVARSDRQGPSVMATLMDLAAGEAQVLLVGDMGLGTAR